MKVLIIADRIQYLIGIVMADLEDGEFKFEIKAYSPDTIPMDRLAQYMAVFARILGNTKQVHFKTLVPGSTGVVARAQYEAIPKVTTRLFSAKHGDAPIDLLAGIEAANDMLRDDNATGEIQHGKAAQIIYFPGKEIPRPEKVGPFREPASFKGELIRLEGGDTTKHAGIKDAEGRVWKAEMSRDIALQMREFLFELVIVDGIATWVRNEDGAWEVKSFQLTGCVPLSKDSLEDDVQKLRGISGNSWKTMKDPIGFIHESRNDDDEIH